MFCCNGSNGYVYPRQNNCQRQCGGNNYYVIERGGLRGPRGFTGAQGIPGPEGPQGATGPYHHQFPEYRDL